MKRLLQVNEISEYLSLSESIFKEKLCELETKGFPKKLPIFNRWDIRAVDAWLNLQSGLDQPHSKIERLYVEPLNRCPPTLPPDTPIQTSGEYTLESAMLDYLEWFKVHRKTLRDTTYQIDKLILPYFGNIEVSSIEAANIRQWHMELATRPRRIRGKVGEPYKYSKDPMDAEAKRKRQSSANRALVVLKAALNHAYREGKTPSDHAWRRVIAFKRVSIGKGGYLTAEQCKEFIKFCAPDFRTLAKVAIFTGARFSELREMRKTHFDPQSASIFIPYTKSGHPRHISLTSEANDFLIELVQKLQINDRLFVRRDGDPWGPTDPYPRLEDACQLAGIEPRITFHQLRHTYASLLAMNGVPLAVIAKNLGHASTEPCEKYYAHLSPGYVQDTLEKGMPKLLTD